jgi:hypothetical protein
MSKTLEKVIRDNAKQGLVGSQFVIRVLEDHGDHINVYIRPEDQDGETFDFAITGNEIMPYEED